VRCDKVVPHECRWLTNWRPRHALPLSFRLARAVFPRTLSSLSRCRHRIVCNAYQQAFLLCNDGRMTTTRSCRPARLRHLPCHWLAVLRGRPIRSALNEADIVFHLENSQLEYTLPPGDLTQVASWSRNTYEVNEPPF
jgi:hypothetical protein